ncbi:MAG: hypothetical protein Tsb0020_44480 [Haliangiales bacterium]
MTKPDKPARGKLALEKLALLSPNMTVLSDRPLKVDAPDLDHLNLAVKLGPIYDILRHTKTQTPLAVAIYGDWGTGKTSAMRWLEGLLAIWNRQYAELRALRAQAAEASDGGEHDEHNAPSDPGVIVRSVWFCPWKYRDQDEVWRGLIAEVILASIDVRGATEERVLTALKQLGMFLGRSFLHALASMRLSVGGASVDMRRIDEVLADYHDTAHPEAAYLNQFERTLGKWIRDTISDAGERMVVFIDDLDRCMPEVALRVLEALKLYLNIPDLVFVVGVDRSVIDQLVREHYTRLGLEPEKSKHYLAKMFQVEVVVAPSESQAEDFLDLQLRAISENTNKYWTTRLKEHEQEIFRGVLLQLAKRNPRELKRLLNSALIHGAGALRVKAIDEGATRDKPQVFSFAQGVQIYLVRKILDERYTMGLHVDTKNGMRFFHAWSQLVRTPGNPRTISPALLARELERRANGGGAVDVAIGAATGAPIGAATDAAIGAATDAAIGAVDEPDPLSASAGDVSAGDAAPAASGEQAHPYQALLRERRFGPSLLRLLEDETLGELMQVEYPANTSALAEATERTLPQGLIRETVARLRNKEPAALSESDYRAITQLDLEGLEISDLTPLAVLTELEELVLSFTDVESIAPLSQLSKLAWLALAQTKVSDLGPIQHLHHMRSLSLAETLVVNLGPLQGLTQLESLNLRGVPADNIEPIAHLTQLSSLSLASTKVTNLSPLRHLDALRSLSLVNMALSDLRPLAKLTGLTALHLSRTEVADLSPLSDLVNLETLSLSQTAVVDLSPLRGLSALQLVDVRNTEVDGDQVSALCAANPSLQVLQ